LPARYSLSVHIVKAIKANSKNYWYEISVGSYYDHKKKTGRARIHPLLMRELKQSGQLTANYNQFSARIHLSPMPMPTVAISYTYPTFLAKSHHPKGTTSLYPMKEMECEERMPACTSVSPLQRPAKTS
jgi:hypothetical protein